MSELVGVGGEVPTVRGGSEEGKELGDGVGGSVRERARLNPVSLFPYNPLP